MPVRLRLVSAGLCVLVAACSSKGPTAAPTGSAPPSAPAVAESLLDALLLGTADLNAAMGTTGLTGSGLKMRMSDATNLVSRPECLPIYGPAGERVYAASGYTAVRHQSFSDPGFAHSATEAVVLFPSASQATAFFGASAQGWQACANTGFLHTMSGGRDSWEVGPVANADGLLSTSARITQEIFDHPSTGGPWTAQRVLTVRNNVVIDVITDSSTGSEPTARTITAQIAARIPG
jgi:hypothetical protein